MIGVHGENDPDDSREPETLKVMECIRSITNESGKRLEKGRKKKFKVGKSKLKSKLYFVLWDKTSDFQHLQLFYFSTIVNGTLLKKCKAKE